VIGEIIWVGIFIHEHWPRA